MPYEFITAKRTMKDAAENAMTALDQAEKIVHTNGSAAEVLAEIGNGYARLAQAMADAIEETA